MLALVIALIALAGAAAWGSGVFGSLQSSGGFTSPNSESQRASDLAASAFGRNDADVVVLYRSPAMTVADPAYRAAVTRSLAALPHGRVTAAQTYWSTGSARFVSTNRHETYAVLQLAGSSDDARTTSYNAIKNDLNAPRLHTLVGGNVPTYESINTEVKADIGRAEAFSMPVLLILLLVIFGSLTSALLPLAIGGTAIIGSFAVLRVLTLGTAVSTYSINITTILGLGLGIDYGLFMVGRFREELRRQPNVQDAVARTVATAGRTVVVSGITVAVALSSLMLFPEVFLRSMGYGGVATVLVDMLAALTLLPALLALLGHRVNSLRVRRMARPAVGHDHGGAWRRIAGSVMRRPVLYVVAIVAALLALGTPFLSVKWGGTDSRVLPASSQPHQVADALNRDFPVNATNPIEAVVRLPVTVSSPAGHAALAAYTGRLGHVAGVTGAQITGARGNVARVDLRYAPQAYSTQAREIVQRVRAVPGPAGATVLVGGITAGLVDELASIGQTLPWMALMVGLATFVLLFLAFGSVVLPLKAIVMNAASLTAAFGAIVWIFQDGHLSGLLNFTPRQHRPGHAHPDAGHHLRPVHGLRGVPAVTDPGAVRHHLGQHDRGGGRSAADRRHHHVGCAAADHRGGGVFCLQHRLHQAAGRGDGHRPGGGRLGGPGAAGARDHAAARPGQLVGPAAAAPPVRAVRHPRGGRPAPAGARPGPSPRRSPGGRVPRSPCPASGRPGGPGRSRRPARPAPPPPRWRRTPPPGARVACR